MGTEKDIFRRNLLKAISNSGKQQKDIAKELNIQYTTFNNWCTGVSVPSLGKIQMLADYFNIGKSDLLEEKEVPEYVPGTVELIDLFSRVTDEQRNAVLALLRSFVD